MTEIMLVRHGETDWNVEEVFRGRIDVELNQTGLKQAALLADYLAGVRIDAIYSSPLKRAQKTAEAIASRHQLDIKIAPGLIDFDFGEWQGLPLQEVKDKYKERYMEWLNSPNKVRVPSGDSLDDVQKRAMNVVNKAIAEYQGTVVLVSHRVVNKALICALLGLDSSHFWNIKQDTCGITIFAYENGRFILIKHNDTSFLRSFGKTPLSDF